MALFLSACLSLSPTILSLCVSFSQHVFLTLAHSIHLSLCLSFFSACLLSLSICLTLSIRLVVSLSLRMSVSLSLRLTFPLCVYLSLSLSMSVSVSLPLYLCMSVSLSLCMTIYLSLRFPFHHHRIKLNWWKKSLDSSVPRSIYSTDFHYCNRSCSCPPFAEIGMKRAHPKCQRK